VWGGGLELIVSLLVITFSKKMFYYNNNYRKLENLEEIKKFEI
jgi:hypothetical protein